MNIPFLLNNMVHRTYKTVTHLNSQLYSKQSAQTGSVLVLTISIMFMVASQLLMMGLLSTSTVTNEGAATSASQEAREEAGAAMSDLRLHLIKFYNSRGQYGASFNGTVLNSNRNLFEFTGKRYYVMNDAFNGATTSPYRVTGRIVGTTSPYTLLTTASGNGLNYTLRQQISLPDYTSTTWFKKRSMLRDSVGVLQTLLLRGYSYQSEANKFLAAQTEAGVAQGVGVGNTLNGVQCYTPAGGTRCFTDFWVNETQYNINYGTSGNVFLNGFMSTSEWHGSPGIDAGGIDLLGIAVGAHQNSIAYYPLSNSEIDKRRVTLILPTNYSSAPSSLSYNQFWNWSPTAFWCSPAVSVVDTPFQFTVPSSAGFAGTGIPNESLDEYMWDNTFGPNGVQS
jgi:hypothetical protein